MGLVATEGLADEVLPEYGTMFMLPRQNGRRPEICMTYRELLREMRKSMRDDAAAERERAGF